MEIIKKSNVKEPVASWLISSHMLNPLLYESLDSCFSQTQHDFEMIFVCNGELRNKIAKNLLLKYADEDRLTIVMTDMHYLTHSLNLGLDLCRAEYIVRMDSDDRCMPDRLKIQLAYMKSNPDVCVLGSYYKIIDENGFEYNEVKLPSSNLDIRKSLRWWNPICHPSVIYRKSVICRIGGYMGSIQSEDYDLWVRLALNKQIKFAAIEKPLLYYRSVSASGTRRSIYAYSSMASVQLRMFLITLNPKWFLGGVVSITKILYWRMKGG